MKKSISVFLLLLSLAYPSFGAYTMEQARAMKIEFWEKNSVIATAAENLTSIVGNPQECTEGTVSLNGNEFDCDNVNFLSFLGLEDIWRPREGYVDNLYQMSDIWGYLSPSGREITLVCQTNSLMFIDSTDPIYPKVLGYLNSPRNESYWCDVKVHANTAYVVQDGGFDDMQNYTGMLAFNLTRLEDPEVLNSDTPITFEPDFSYREHGPVHNVVVDNDSGFLFTVGTSGGNNCDGGLHMVDLSNPLEPTFAGCAAEDGYVHDAQCIVYKGPDMNYYDKEICFGYNEDEITIYDVTNKSNPLIISKTGYPEAAYTHQGWLNPDQTHILMNDELDEYFGNVSHTRSYIVNITSLEEPVFTGYYNHSTVSIDHNLYFFGDIHRRGYGGNGPIENHPALDYAYCSNYASGIRILNTSSIADDPPIVTQAGFFDVSLVEGNVFFGAWSSYLHPSGVLAVSCIERGVFFLNFTGAFEDWNANNNLVDSGDVNGMPIGLVVLYVVLGIVALLVVVYNVRSLTSTKKNSNYQKPAQENEIPHQSGFQEKKASDLVFS